MNLLQSLAIRTLESAAAIAPPRVPYVNVFPEQPTGGFEAVEEAMPQSAPASPTVPPPLVSTRTTVRTPAPGPRPAAPPSPAAPSGPAPTGARAEPEPQERLLPSITRVVEHWRDAEPPVVTRETAAAPPAPPPLAAPTAVPEATREIIETHHHHRVDHTIVPIVQVVEQVSRPAPPARHGVEPPVVRPAPAPAPPAPPRMRMADRRAASRNTGRDASEPAAPPPSIHVAIGRITVRLQPQPVSARSETTRPVAPEIDLKAYTAEQRSRKR